MTPILRVEDLHVKDILSVPRLDVRRGEVLTVVGPNGAGKSTLLLTLAGLLRPEAGQVWFDGAPLDFGRNLSYRRRIGLVMQAPLLQDISVFDNVAAGLRFRGAAEADVRRIVPQWLERLDIAHLSRRGPRKLSGGEAQRVSLARALAVTPDLLLLDEPFSALDAPTRAHLIGDLQSLLAETGITTVFITHDLDEALQLGDRMTVLIDGQVRQIAAPEDIFAAPADADVAAFVGVETVVPGTVSRSGSGMVLVQVKDQELEAVRELDVGREVLFCVRPEDVTLHSKKRTPGSSARNCLSGVIRQIVPQGALMRVTLDCSFPLTALVTRASAREMGLAEGRTVQASFKASAVHLIPR
ncbi:MAG: ABC transporter ATP-binding protein [Chloroflexi bacterium]|nr:ABC transporter ATP-binding protein [Chloroflexota bacterium]